MLLHILKLIKTQRRSNTWVFIELLVVFVLLWYAVDRMTMSRITQAQPMGYSFEDVYKVTLAVRPSTSASYITYEQGSQGRERISCVSSASWKRIPTCRW